MTETYPPALMQLFLEIGQMTPEETRKILPLWQHHFSLRRNDFLSTPDQRERYIYFVISGALRIYCLDTKGEEVCLGFSYDNSLAGSYPSIITSKPAGIFVQALGPCELLGAVWEDLIALAQEIPNFERFRRILAEETLLGRMEREIEMLTLPPAERYERVFRRSPHLFQYVPQKYIASYLGITPETLSRIRSKKS